jgi:hypothetical protein
MSEELPDPDHRAPAGASDAVVEAVGGITEALETCERARGHLYAFHQLTGSADLRLGEALTTLREAGHAELADDIETDLVGRNVLAGRWTFQLVEEYDDGYWSRFRDWERRVRDTLTDGRRHVHEARLKHQERTAGRPGHEADPRAVGEA